MKIASIYKKYGTDNPLGWGTIDIKNGNSGWFYDGSPENVTYYADSPEWFNQFCGEQGAYIGLVSEEKRHGYRNRDYNTALESITALIDKNKMTEEDRNEIIEFFNKCWHKYGNTKPGLILVSYYEVLSNEEVEKDRKKFELIYGDKRGFDYLFEDIISCHVTGNNRCCKKNILPENLSVVDLSGILPKYIIQRNSEKEITLAECIKKLKGFNLEDLKKAQEFLRTLEDKTREEY